MNEVKWEKITETKTTFLTRGSLLRCPAQYPYEALVDFLLVLYPDSPSGFALVVSSGYKAGHVLILLPKEALDESSGYRSISVSWLLANWTKWIYEIGPEGVYIGKGYTIEPDWTPESSAKP